MGDETIAAAHESAQTSFRLPSEAQAVPFTRGLQLCGGLPSHADAVAGYVVDEGRCTRLDMASAGPREP